MVKDYIPDRGDLVKLTFNPQAGHEQAGWRPALVLSNKTFNKATGLAFLCPITNNTVKHSLHIPIPEHIPLSGVIMTEQIKSLDFNARNIRFIHKAPPDIIEKAHNLVSAILADDRL